MIGFQDSAAILYFSPKQNVFKPNVPGGSFFLNISSNVIFVIGCVISHPKKINDEPSSLFPNKMQTHRLNDGLICHFLLMTGTGNTNWDWIL